MSEGPQEALLDWYSRHRRDLPWRRNPTPYGVLVSEVMLQQTQVERVIPYYESFLRQFPSLAALANADRADVIRIWGGLGYNRRAAQLHELARIVTTEYEGQLPADREELLRLPGIGPYTAGAVLSIGFGRDEPALDTNVRRVISRYAFGGLVEESALRDKARMLVPTGRAADWNQAVMDLGAQICRSQRPQCLLCPIRAGCLSAGQQPARARKTHREPPFESTNRYYRGRLLAQLRSLAPGVAAPLTQLSSELGAQGVAEPPNGWRTLGEELAQDGLAAIENLPDGIAMRLA